MSLQGPAVARDGRSLYVADYIRGIARVEASSGAVKWLTHPRTVAVSGIDGLALAGEKLIAVQNGLAPHRVIELTLDAAGDGVAAARVLAQDTAAIREPTHGVVRGGEFHFIANSGWDSFDDAGATRKAIQIVVPRVMRVSIDF